MDPAANVMLAAVIGADRAAPIENVPAPYVPLFHAPTWVTATEPSVENVNAVEFVFALDAAAFHEHACRAYEPEFAFSAAPVVEVVAVCSATWVIVFVAPVPSSPFKAAFAAAVLAKAMIQTSVGM